MDGGFACPACGNRLELSGSTPGRQIRCGWCQTWVEVPYLPRAVLAGRGRSRRRKRSWLTWAWVGVGVLTLLVGFAGASRVFRGRSRSAREKAVAERVAAADAATEQGRLDVALKELDRALAEAEQIQPPEPARVEALTRRRGRLARREAEARIAALADIEPGLAVQQAHALLVQARKDPALGGLEEPIRDQLDRSRRRWAELDLAVARQALDRDPARTIALCTRLAGTADELDPAVRKALLDEAETLVAKVIERNGTIIEPVRGVFTIGSPASYTAALGATVVDSLQSRGYVPRPAKPRWGDLWDARSPYHLSIEVIEAQPFNYQQSRNRVSQIEVKFILRRNGAPFWEKHLMGQTRDTLPRLAAYQASRIAVSDRRSLEFERLLYEDAHVQVMEKLAPMLRAMPERSSPAASRPGP